MHIRHYKSKQTHLMCVYNVVMPINNAQSRLSVYQSVHLIITVPKPNSKRRLMVCTSNNSVHRSVLYSLSPILSLSLLLSQSCARTLTPMLKQSIVCWFFSATRDTIVKALSLKCSYLLLF